MINFAFAMLHFKPNISLQTYNTFGLDYQAKYMVYFKNIDELLSILDSEIYKTNAHFILGGGSNILLTHDMDALILKNEIKGIEILREDDQHSWVKFGAGEMWHDCVVWALNHNLGGIENLSLIPGTMGAAPMQNIGAYGVEIKSVVESVWAVDKIKRTQEIFSKADCKFGYRESIFKTELKDKYIITYVVLRLSKNPTLDISYGAIQDELNKEHILAPSIRDVSNAVIRIRQSKLPNPKTIGNAGSFFKNPVVSITEFKNIQTQHPTMPFYKQADGIKIPAGWLIEKAGWKGYLDGDIGVHALQALVLVNYGKGKGLDIYNLSEKIINDIKTRFGIELEREVNVL